MDLIYQSTREVFYLVLNYILHLKKVDDLYQPEYCFCNKYEGSTFCDSWGARLCLLFQLVHHYNEDELYLVKHHPLELIKFAINFLNELDELCRLNAEMKN